MPDARYWWPLRKYKVTHLLARALPCRKLIGSSILDNFFDDRSTSFCRTWRLVVRLARCCGNQGLMEARLHISVGMRCDSLGCGGSDG